MFIDGVLVYDEIVPKHFQRIAIVTGVLTSGDSKIKGAIARMEKTNTILKHPENKLSTVKNEARKQKLGQEAVVIGELNLKHKC